MPRRFGWLREPKKGIGRVWFRDEDGGLGPTRSCSDKEAFSDGKYLSKDDWIYINLFLKMEKGVPLIIPKNAPNSTLTIGSSKEAIRVYLNCTNRGRAPGYMMIRGSLGGIGEVILLGHLLISVKIGATSLELFSPTKHNDNEIVQEKHTHHMLHGIKECGF